MRRAHACLLGLILWTAVAGLAQAQVLQPRLPQPRSHISVNGGYQVTANNFRDGVTFRESAEDGSFVTDYTVEGGPTFNIAAGAAVWRQLGVGVAVTRFSRSTAASLSGSIPHPFFFSRPRSVSAAVGGLKREELAVHVQAKGIIPAGTRVLVMLFGGPSFFQVKQGVVTDFTYTDTYPYDEASFRSSVTTTAKGSKIGFNVGGDVAFFFTRHLGVGGMVQFSGTSVELPMARGGAQEVKAGGIQGGAGLRVRF